MGGTLIIRSGSRVGGCEYCSSECGKHDLRAGSGRARCWVSEGASVACPSDAGPSALGLRFGVMGGWSLFENCTVDASICGQVFKGARWMPWHQEPMKDVGGHDRPRGVVNQALIRGCPNGETRQSSWAVTLA